MLIRLLVLAQLLSPANPETVGRAVARELSEGRFSAVTARFGPRLAEALTEERLRQVWNGLAAQAGPLRESGAPRSEPAGGATVVTVPLRFEKLALDMRVTVGADGKLAGLFFAPGTAPAAPWSAPAYADPKLYFEQDVVIGKEPWSLPGTLTQPYRKGLVPAVVLVHGSGPHDRNETLGPNRPFQDLAWGLASRGIAVLRYEKRTKAHAARMGALPSLTVKEEVTDDVRAAYALLRAWPEVDPWRIAILGHSLGATLAPRIAREEPSVAGLVLLAPAARPIPELMVEQTEYLLSLAGPPDAAKKKQLAELKAEAAKAAKAKPGDPPVLNAPGSYWADLNGYDPAAAAKGFPQPILLLQGERDYQVTSRDVDRFRAALAGRKDVTIRTFPTLNHLFMAGTGKSTHAEYDRAGHVDAAVIDAIAAFVEGLAPVTRR